MEILGLCFFLNIRGKKKCKVASGFYNYIEIDFFLRQKKAT